MIYIIGGSPRGGKSILAKKLGKKINAPYVSTDFLKLMIRPYFKGTQKDKMFPFDKIWKNLDINDYLRDYTGKQMLNIDIQESKTIWPGVKLFISHTNKCKMDYVIEGVHLLPGLVKSFQGDPNIRIIFLTKKEEEKIYHGLLKNRSGRDWVLDNAKDKEALKLFSKALSEHGKYFQKETAKYNFKLINTEDNFPDKINQAIAYLTKK